MTAPSRSALFSFSDRKTIPLRPAFLHSASRWRAIMPKGDEEEIAGRGEGFFRFVALLAPRAFLERPTLNPSLIRDQLGLMANVPSIGSPRCWELCLGQRPYANLVADARLQSRRPVTSRLGAEASRS